MSTSTPPVSVLIVGAGFSGLSVGIRLAADGDEDFTIVEKADDIGGTWRENTYPGCACDVQSHLYSYSFRPNPEWSRMYGRQAEIQQYLQDTVDHYRLRDRIRFGTEFLAARFDDHDGLWHVDLSTGTVTARALVLAEGPLHRPRLPDVPGLDRFAGPTFHSAQWDHDVDLTGKRVAVIGTGASVIQFVPHLAEQAEHLTLVQRTPPWILPKLDRRIAGWEKRLFRALPAAQRLWRWAIYWRNEARMLGMKHPRLAGLMRWISRRHIHKQITDPELAKALTPDFALGCKRILLSNDYYPALNRDNVALVTDELTQVDEEGIVTADGRHHPADVIVYGTGFHVTSALDHLRITGRDGADLRTAWADGPHAYLGSTVPGFPNLFFMLGPNTGLGHNSMIFMAEAHTRYIAAALAMLREFDARHLDVRTDAEDAFVRKARGALRHRVWSTGGCHSWYVDPDGVNRTLWPGYTLSFWWRTRSVTPHHYTLTH